jgi:uncharacterized membrane protein YfcA
VRLTPGLTLKLAPARAEGGLAAGFFGIGRSFLTIPVLMTATGMTLAHAAASSLVSISYASSGPVNWPIFVGLVAGGGIGAGAGLFAAPFFARTAR